MSCAASSAECQWAHDRKIAGAGSIEKAIRTAMIAMTTRSSMSVNPRRFIAVFRGPLTCLIRTQFPQQTGLFFAVFLAVEARDMGAN
jgi:hypothetical protein